MGKDLPEVNVNHDECRKVVDHLDGLHIRDAFLVLIQLTQSKFRVQDRLTGNQSLLALELEVSDEDVLVQEVLLQSFVAYWVKEILLDVLSLLNVFVKELEQPLVVLILAGFVI